ncbi:MAG: NrfD/PsrC family molybdoenzyme membrane anchor subunit [Spirochaetota bacterium]
MYPNPLIHGEVWTAKELFVLPNENIYWSLQIVCYPFMTGLVAGAFVLSSLYHVFGIKQLKDIARFALVFSFALLFAAPMTLLLHLLHPERAFNVFATPHFTSAIASFGVIFFTYASIVATEIWLIFRKRFVEKSRELKTVSGRNLVQNIQYLFWSALTLGAFDISEESLHRDEKAVKVMAGIGIPVAFFLHGYVGFIFGSVKANALWMTPLMPVIFIMSAVVSGIALCVVTYIATHALRKALAKAKAKRQSRLADPIADLDVDVIRSTLRYLMFFLIIAISLELLDLVFRGYTAVKSWDALRSVIYQRDFLQVFVFQYGIGDVIPLILLLLPKPSIKRAAVTAVFVLFGIFMMRWNVVIGGQAFSLTFAGFMHYELPIIPRDMETYKEGVFGALTVFSIPFILFFFFNKILPVFEDKKAKI